MAAYAYDYDEDFDDDEPTRLFLRAPEADQETDSWHIETRPERPVRPRRAFASERLIRRTRFGTAR